MDAYLELVDLHCDVVSGRLVHQQEVLEGHPALAVLYLPADLLQLHQQPGLLLVIFSVGFNHFIMIDVLAGTNMSDFSFGDCENKDQKIRRCLHVPC